MTPLSCICFNQSDHSLPPAPLHRTSPKSTSSLSSYSAREVSGGIPTRRPRAHRTRPGDLIIANLFIPFQHFTQPYTMFDKLWDGLCLAEAFGAETMAVTVWTVFVCLLRALLFSIRVFVWVPNALVFANPFLMERFLQAFRNKASPFSSSLLSGIKRNSNGYAAACATIADMSSSSSSSSSTVFPSSLTCRTRVVPHLPVRIAESLLGRTPSIFVLLPAHFLGGIMGVTIVKLFLGPSSFTQSYSARALLPIIYGGSNGDAAPLLLLGWWVFIKEILVTALYVVGLLVLPQVFIINHLPRQCTYACLLPLLLIRLPDQTPAFAPATLFSLWFTSRDTLRAVHGMTSIQYEHVFGPILGGFLAGGVMVACFPDDDVPL